MKILKLAFCWNDVKLSNKEQNVNFASIGINNSFSHVRKRGDSPDTPARGPCKKWIRN